MRWTDEPVYNNCAPCDPTMNHAPLDPDSYYPSRAPMIKLSDEVQAELAFIKNQNESNFGWNSIVIVRKAIW